MRRSSRRSFLKSAGLFIPASFAIARARGQALTHADGALLGAVQSVSVSSSLLTNIAAYWKLDAASGNESDSVGSSTLVDNGTCGSEAGKVGNCRTFDDDVPEWFSCADNAALSLGSDTPYTCALWVKPTTGVVSGSEIIAKGATSRTFCEFILTIRTSDCQFYIGNGSTNINVNGPNLTRDAWSFIVFYHDPDANTIGISVNNAAATTTSWSGGTLNDGAGALTVGVGYAGTEFQGSIDEIGYWKRVLSSDECTTLYNSGNGKTYPFS